MEKTVFIGNCVNANNCLNFTCEWYTPMPYTSETLPGPSWCEEKDKLVFVLPLHDIIPDTRLIEEKEGILTLGD